MQKDGPDLHHVEQIGPSDLHDPLIRAEFRKAFTWVLTAAGMVLIVVLVHPILLIIGGIVFAAAIDGGARLIAKVIPLPRPLRIAIVVAGGSTFVLWIAIQTGTQLSDQAADLQVTIEMQLAQFSVWAHSIGLTTAPHNVKTLGAQIFGSLGPVTEAVTTFVGGLASLVMMAVMGIFLAAEPRLYERGLAWMLPLSERRYFYGTADIIGQTLRRLLAGRLLGMGVEGFATWLLLALGGVPMAALLGVITGLLAFLPNIGVIVSGALIILVGFSSGTETGFYAIAVYLIVHFLDGYIVVPMVARRTVDLAPALVLGAQILFGAMFGILGLALADPIVAMLKVALERRSEHTRAHLLKNRRRRAAEPGGMDTLDPQRPGGPQGA